MQRDQVKTRLPVRTFRPDKVDDGFLTQGPAYLDLKIVGTYENVNVRYSEYRASHVFQGGNLYERKFDWVTVRHRNCKVEVVGKRVIITANGVRFVKKASNKNLKVFYGFDPSPDTGVPTVTRKPSKDDYET